MIEIVFITDENYVLPTLTAIISIRENVKETLNVNVIYSSDISEDISNFKSLSDEKVNVNVIQIANPYEAINAEHQHVSKAAMIKFALPNIFADKNKILYLDSDMLILDDISELYNTNLDNNYAAVVEDYEAILGSWHKTFSIPKFFNSGMMLLNLDLLRKENVTEKLLEAKKNETIHPFMDQTAFNLVFNQRFISISPKYNLMKANLEYQIEDIAKFYNTNIEEMEKIINNPNILHVTNISKPWSDSFAPVYEEWIKYCRKLPLEIQLHYLLKSRDMFNKKSLQTLKNEILQETDNKTNTLKNEILQETDNKTNTLKNEFLQEIESETNTFKNEIFQETNYIKTEFAKQNQMLNIELQNKSNQLNEITLRLKTLEDKYNELTKYTFLEKIFSVKNTVNNNKKHKVLTILGIKFKFKIGEQE